MIKRIVFLGAPGVGKGTISEILSKEFNISHISTGDIFRKEIANKTKLGAEVINITSTGGYVPDKITNEIIKNTINTPEIIESGYILDGYPRTISQSEFLKENSDVEAFILLEAPLELIVKRLSGRRSCPKCKKGYHVTFSAPNVENICDIDGETLIQRKDDQPEAIKTRLKIYDEYTLPLIRFYEKEGLIKRIDASSTPKQIVAKIKEEIFND